MTMTKKPRGVTWEQVVEVALADGWTMDENGTVLVKTWEVFGRRVKRHRYMRVVGRETLTINEDNGTVSFEHRLSNLRFRKGGNSGMFARTW